jgi:hypothetical protein
MLDLRWAPGQTKLLGCLLDCLLDCPLGCPGT